MPPKSRQDSPLTLVLQRYYSVALSRVISDTTAVPASGLNNLQEMNQEELKLHVILTIAL